MNTAQDVVDYLLTATGGGAQDGEHRAVRSAVVHACREVFQTRDWLWHTTEGSFTTQQLSTTVTAMTKGSNVITVSSTTGMYPNRILAITPNSFSYTVRIASVSGNQVTLTQPSSQTLTIKGTVADLSSLPTVGLSDGDAYYVTAEQGGLYVWSLNGSTWSATNVPTALVQTFYDLPLNLKDVDGLVTETVGTLYCYIQPQEWQQLQINTRGAGEPYYYTVMRSDADPLRWQIRFVGVPTNGTVVYYMYRYTPLPIKLMGYEPSCRAGTATVASPNFTTVTFTGTTLPPDLEGAVIRFGTADNDADPIGALNPWVHERKIVSRVNNTTLTVDTALPALSGVKYAISSIIDSSPTMYTAVLSATEMWYARLVGKDASQPTALFNRDLRLAMENDTISPAAGRIRRQYPTPRTMGYYSPLLPDVG